MGFVSSVCCFSIFPPSRLLPLLSFSPNRAPLVFLCSAATLPFYLWYFFSCLLLRCAAAAFLFLSFLSFTSPVTLSSLLLTTLAVYFLVPFYPLGSRQPSLFRCFSLPLKTSRHLFFFSSCVSFFSIYTKHYNFKPSQQGYPLTLHFLLFF